MEAVVYMQKPFMGPFFVANSQTFKVLSIYKTGAGKWKYRALLYWESCFSE